MAGVDGVSPIAGVSGIDQVMVHAPINDGVDAQFWQDRQSKRRRGGDAEDEAEDAPEPEAPARAPAAISMTDTLSLHAAEPVENPFVSLIEHEMHLHLPTAPESGKVPR